MGLVQPVPVEAQAGAQTDDLALPRIVHVGNNDEGQGKWYLGRW
jgi:hypothetical protein